MPQWSAPSATLAAMISAIPILLVERCKYRRPNQSSYFFNTKLSFKTRLRDLFCLIRCGNFLGIGI